MHINDMGKINAALTPHVIFSTKQTEAPPINSINPLDDTKNTRVSTGISGQ